MTAHLSGSDRLYPALLARGLSRRDLLRFSAAMAAALALPPLYGPRIASAIERAPRLPLVWLRGQDCGGDTTAWLRAANPTVAELMLDELSVEYHESLMAASGAEALASLAGSMEAHPNGYLAVIEGSIPTAGGGAACLVGGRPFVDVVREVTAGAIGTFAVGSCAVDGGHAAATGGRTGATGVEAVIAGSRPLLNLPGCPVNTDNLVAALVHYLTFREFPVTDARRRPLFAYGGLIHNQCERRAHFEFGEFVLAWGDEGAQKGWCLYKMGCKGPETYANCPTQRYADATSWPVKAGHGCIGCHAPGFWDLMGDAYRRLPAPIALAPDVTVDQLGAALVGGVGALTVGHGAAMALRQRRRSRPEQSSADHAAQAPIRTDDTAGASVEELSTTGEAAAGAGTTGQPTDEAASGQALETEAVQVIAMRAVPEESTSDVGDERVDDRDEATDAGDEP